MRVSSVRVTTRVRRERLIERDVAVFADASEEEVESAGSGNRLLVGGALCIEVGSIAVEDVDILRGLVDEVEEVAVHE